MMQFFLDRLENIVGKGEKTLFTSILCFSLNVFQNGPFSMVIKSLHCAGQGLTLWELEKILISNIFSCSCCLLRSLNSLPPNPNFNDLEKYAFRNIVGKGENAGNQHFLLFPQCFLPFPKQISVFHLL